MSKFFSHPPFIILIFTSIITLSGVILFNFVLKDYIVKSVANSVCNTYKETSDKVIWDLDTSQKLKLNDRTQIFRYAILHRSWIGNLYSRNERPKLLVWSNVALSASFGFNISDEKRDANIQKYSTVLSLTPHDLKGISKKEMELRYYCIRLYQSANTEDYSDYYEEMEKRGYSSNDMIFSLKYMNDNQIERYLGEFNYLKELYKINGKFEVTENSSNTILEPDKDFNNYYRLTSLYMEIPDMLDFVDKVQSFDTVDDFVRDLNN